MIQNVLDKMGFDSLNDIQEASIEANIHAKDVVILAPTGSGKTLGFLLPVLAMLDPEVGGVQALILVPARELAMQIEQVFRTMGTGHKVSCCYGGHPMRIEKNNLLQAPAVLVGTPGRITDHIGRGNIDVSTIKTLVLDEFDKSLEMGFEREMTYIINQLSDIQKHILTSATQSIEIPSFTGIKSAVELNFLSDTMVQGLTQKAVRSVGRDKLDVFFRLICELGNETTLVFCNHREAVNRTSKHLSDKGIVHDIFHGGMEQDERERALLKFRNKSHHLLITTDLASRGLDIPEVKNIIHYHLPNKEDAFIHRNGRTARMNAEGTSFVILGEDEDLPKYITEAPVFVEVNDLMEVPPLPEWVTLYIGGGKKDKINKIDIVGLLLQKGGLKKDELGLIEVLDHTAFVAVKRSKANKVLDLLMDERIKKKKVKIAISK
ncbi:MAG: DEAD/DEAH box helicase [Bacteroidales bacterium]|nr:DEAD/DEAH box helicase [Bacteroidales bacterium]